jgi:nucleoside-diphosphate-sugar epimerase
VQKVMTGVNYVLHQAALPSVPRSINDPVATNQANVNGTLNVLVAARDQHVHRVVVASSSSIYGNSRTLPKVETMQQQPLSPYATSKLAAERYALNFHAVYGLPTVALRYFNVFGPNQDPTSQYAAVIPKFVTAMLQNDAFYVYGDGEQSRDFTYIDNVIEANLLACQSETAPGRVFNVACGLRFTLNQMISTLEKYIGVQARAQYVEARSGDVKHSLADIGLAREHLGFIPVVTFEEGLQLTVDWFKQKLAKTSTTSTYQTI